MGRKVAIIIFISFLLSLFIYGELLLITTFNDSPEEISCVGAMSGSGVWRADNPWNLFIGQFKGESNFMNCDCGIFGKLESKNHNSTLPICVYNKQSYLNNSELCLQKGKEFINFDRGICICNGVDDEERGDVCLPRDTWEEFINDREKGFWSDNEFWGQEVRPHLITFGILFLIILILTSIGFKLFVKK